MHEITEIVLYIPKREAYKVYKKQCKDEDNISEEEWEKSYEKHLMFKFWDLILKLELLLLEFVKSLCSANFQCYVETLKQITPWMFSLNHHNYARWLLVHLTPMIDPKEMHLLWYEKFVNRKFVVWKTNRKFSKTALDQSHQQLNASIKGVGGAIGLTENDAALQKLLINGPEAARLLEEYKNFHTVDEECVLEHRELSAVIIDKITIIHIICVSCKTISEWDLDILRLDGWSLQSIFRWKFRSLSSWDKVSDRAKYNCRAYASRIYWKKATSTICWDKITSNNTQSPTWYEKTILDFSEQ